jgi:hypothetical protein
MIERERESMFDLTQEQWSKFHAWKAEQNKKISEQRKGAKFEKSQINGQPYSGAIGGSYTYSFTPTSIGLIITVKNDLTEDELDLTDYDNF